MSHTKTQNNDISHLFRSSNILKTVRLLTPIILLYLLMPPIPLLYRKRYF